MKGLIQIAGVLDREEAAMLVEAGVHQLGFPLKLAHHGEDLSEDHAAAIIRMLTPPASVLVITYLNKAHDILGLCDRVGAKKVQLHGDVTVSELKRLRSLVPEIVVIKSLIVKGHNLPELKSSLFELSPYVDAFITDTYDPDSGACGATGKTHDWDISRELVEISPKPLILAGGLNPKNIRKAVLYVRPAGVDSHTGVEGADGRKDAGLVRSFVNEATAAFADL